MRIPFHLSINVFDACSLPVWGICKWQITTITSYAQVWTRQKEQHSLSWQGFCVLSTGFNQNPVIWLSIKLTGWGEGTGAIRQDFRTKEKLGWAPNVMSLWPLRAKGFTHLHPASYNNLSWSTVGGKVIKVSPKWFWWGGVNNQWFVISCSTFLLFGFFQPKDTGEKPNCIYKWNNIKILWLLIGSIFFHTITHHL